MCAHQDRRAALGCEGGDGGEEEREGEEEASQGGYYLWHGEGNSRGWGNSRGGMAGKEREKIAVAAAVALLLILQVLAAVRTDDYRC